MNQKMRTYLITMLVLVLLSAGMFVYVNFFSGREERQTATVYTANTDIVGYTEITPDLFTSREIPADAVVDGMVTNLSAVSGTYSKGPIYQGDILTESSITKEIDGKDMEYTINFQPTYSGDVAFGDIVDVYQISPSNEITLLYSRKKVEKAKTVSSEAVTESGTYEAATALYFKVTKEEMLEYYSKLNSYKFIVLPLNMAYSDIEGLIEETDSNDDSTNYNITTETISQDGLTAKAYADMKGIDIDEFMNVNPTIANENDLLENGTTVNIPEDSSDESTIIE